MGRGTGLPTAGAAGVPRGGSSAGATRYAKAPIWCAWLILVAVLALGAAPFLAPKLLPGHGRPERYNDSDLYRDVTARVAVGQGYYRAAEIEQRAHRYPTRPAVAFREPTLAYLLAALGQERLRRLASVALVAAAVFAFRHALDRTTMPARWRTPATLLMATGAMAAWWPEGTYMHEAWAGPLIVLSLAAQASGRWLTAVLIAVAACALRELALPYLGVMAAFALAERRWGEAAGWVVGGVIFCAGFSLHLAVAARHHLPGDLSSQGWITFNGWAFAVATAKRNALLILAPDFVASFALILALLGLLSSRDPLISRCACIVSGFVGAFLIVGRPSNAYWGDLYGPLLPLGWVLAPAALLELARIVRRSLPGRPQLLPD